MSIYDWIYTILLASFLSSIHFIIPPISSLSVKRQKIISSLGGGFAISYIFLHLMPELATGGSLLSNDINITKFTPTPIIEASLFFVALFGVILFFSIDVVSESTRKPSKINFICHLSALSFLNYLYSYTLPSLVSTGWGYSLLFTIAISAHLLTSERVLVRSHFIYYKSKVRCVGICSIVLGILHAYFFHPLSDLSLAIATAFLGGGVLLTAFREELPKASRTSLPWFVIGSLLMSSALVFLMLIGHH